MALGGIVGGLLGLNVNAVVSRVGKMGLGVSNALIRSTYFAASRELAAAETAGLSIRGMEKILKVRLANPIIRAGVARGLTPTRITRLLEQGGMSFRKADMLTNIADVQGRAKESADLRFLRRGLKPDPDRLVMAKGKIDHRYSFDFTLEYADRETRERSQKYVTISRDELLTREAMEEIATSRGERYGEEAGGELVKVSLTGGRKEGEFGTRSGFAGEAA